jgi:hypothetical protein
MACLSNLLLLAGAYPLWLAWQSNRRTSLRHAIGWAWLAWAGWVGVTALDSVALGGLEEGRYVALALTSCAGVAVLGARRPGVVAWDFVVLGLLAVMLLPLAERLLAGGPLLDPVQVIFLCATLAVGILNYVPTRLAPAALVLGLGCAWEVLALLAVSWLPRALVADTEPAGLAIAWTPLLALVAWRWRAQPAGDIDHMWRDFRDRFGVVWGQRLREQFNRAAANAGWPLHLGWRRLRVTTNVVPPEATAVFQALLKRFLGDDQAPAGFRPCDV